MQSEFHFWNWINRINDKGKLLGTKKGNPEVVLIHIFRLAFMSLHQLQFLTFQN